MDVKVCLKAMLNDNSLDSNSETTSVCREGRNRTLRLPAIEIPIFDGNLQNWTSFIDIFNAMFYDPLGLGTSTEISISKITLNWDCK